MICFASGYLLRVLITPSHPVPEDGLELLWFNPKNFQWERVREDSPISPRDRVIMGFPITFAEVKEKNDE
jgi:hypothetical protein